MPDISAQDCNESRRLWEKVSKALQEKKYNLATDEKSSLEEDQRHFAKLRQENDLDWQPNFFRQQNDGQWVLIEKYLYKTSALIFFIYLILQLKV